MDRSIGFLIIEIHLMKLIKKLNKCEKKTISTHEFSEYEDRYQLFSFISLILIMAAFITPTRNEKT